MKQHLNSKKDPNTKSLVITFSSHLGSIFNTSQKLSYFKELGIDYTLILPFSIRSMDHKSFISFLKQFNIESIVVGENFRFGRNREGSYLDLEQVFKDIVYVPSYIKDSSNKIISSTRIKNEILNKNISTAINLMDHPLIIEGGIISGIHEASSLGVPTININPNYVSIIPNGVYLGYTKLFNSSFLTNNTYQSLYDKDIYYKYFNTLNYKISNFNSNTSTDPNIPNDIDITIKVHKFLDKYSSYTPYILKPTQTLKSLIHIGTRPTLEKLTNTSSSSLLVESHIVLNNNNDNNNDYDLISSSNHSTYNYAVFYIKKFLEEEKTFSSKEELISALSHYKEIAKNSDY